MPLQKSLNKKIDYKHANETNKNNNLLNKLNEKIPIDNETIYTNMPPNIDTSINSNRNTLLVSIFFLNKNFIIFI